MPKGTFRFYEELNDFLPEHRKKSDFEAPFIGKRSIKDMIESFGVPHTEIDLILVNGKSVDFNYILRDGDRVSVYPVFESLNITDVTRLRKIPLRRNTFIVDINLGDILKYMRVLGFDCFYNPLLTSREIVEISNTESRIILTRSTKLLKSKGVTHGIFLRPGTTPEQIRRIIDDLDIKDNIKPFSRCLVCNTPLKSVSKEKILNRIPPKTKESCDENVQCPSCGKIYWKGTHFMNMKKVVRQILDQTES
jgi:uncharacterized protein with PIN domain